MVCFVLSFSIFSFCIIDFRFFILYDCSKKEKRSSKPTAPRRKRSEVFSDCDSTRPGPSAWPRCRPQEKELCPLPPGLLRQVGRRRPWAGEHGRRRSAAVSLQALWPGRKVASLLRLSGQERSSENLLG